MANNDRNSNDRNSRDNTDESTTTNQSTGSSEQEATTSFEDVLASSLEQNLTDGGASNNEVGSDNQNDVDNTLGSDNDVLSYNIDDSFNSVLSGNALGSNNAYGSDNVTGSGNTTTYAADILSANELLSGNVTSSDNDTNSGNVTSTLSNTDKLFDRSETEGEFGAARDLIEAEGDASVTADDIAVSMNSLTGDGNDSRTVAENTNDLRDSDEIEDIDMNLGPAAVLADAGDRNDDDDKGRGKDRDDDDDDKGRGDDDDVAEAAGGQVFSQNVSAEAELARVADGMDDGQSFTDVKGDIDLSVSNLASASAGAVADGAAQDVKSGSNTALNEGVISAIGGSEADTLSETMNVTEGGEPVLSGNDIASGNQNDVSNTDLSGNDVASGNIDDSSNAFGSGNDVVSGNDIKSGNRTDSGNDVDGEISVGSENLYQSNNVTGSGNDTNTDNVSLKETNTSVIRDSSEVEISDFAANELIEAEDEATVLLDDITVDYGTLSGAGNDMAFDLDQANNLVDVDTIGDITLTLNGSFEQTVTADAGEALAGDGTVGGEGTMFSDIIGDVSVDVANVADASAIAQAQGITQTIASGGNVMLNSFDMSVTGGDSSFDQSFDDMIG
ncbi:hypothetical protein [Celeribacter marinus]|uniref:hypothetical protein n=1 Tax=Celeribacter marinus TaxID=1397108 RepID=UPI0031744001